MFEKRLNSPTRLIHWPITAALLALMLAGAAFIFSAKPEDSYHLRQILWYGVGLVAAVLVCLVDYHRLTRFAMVAYLATLLLLAWVLVFGKEGGGARRWIDLVVFQLQPSEFAKLAFIFAQAHFLSRPLEELRWRSVFWQSIAMTAGPFILILLEPDLGSALVFFPICLVMMLVAGVPVRYLAKWVGIVSAVVVLMLINILFMPQGWGRIPIKEYQRERLLVYFGKSFAEPGATESERRAAQLREREKSYNIRQALISVGSGGVFGKGWQQGTQTTLGYLPQGVAHNDFIFSVIAEETGFVGSCVIIALYGTILVSGIRIASQARDRLGKVLAAGVVTLLFCHIFVNIGMNLRLMPVTGIPLPLLSYGGSSVLSSLIAAGVLQNIHLYRRAY